MPDAGEQLRQAISSGLPAIRNRIAGRVPMEVLALVGGIGMRLEHLGSDPNRLLPGSDELYIVRRIVEDYLPSTLEGYLQLPRTYADTQAVTDGKTAKEVVIEQLELLRDRLAEVDDAARRGDASTLLTNRRFLQDRFGSSDSLKLDGDAGG